MLWFCIHLTAKQICYTRALFCFAITHLRKIQNDQNHNKQKCEKWKKFRKALLDSFGNYIWKDITILHLGRWKCSDRNKVVHFWSLKTSKFKLGLCQASIATSWPLARFLFLLCFSFQFGITSKLQKLKRVLWYPKFRVHGAGHTHTWMQSGYLYVYY